MVVWRHIYSGIRTAKKLFFRTIEQFFQDTYKVVSGRRKNCEKNIFLRRVSRSLLIYDLKMLLYEAVRYYYMRP